MPLCAQSGGVHQHLAEGVPVPLAELVEGNYPIGSLLDGVNRIECLLL